MEKKIFISHSSLDTEIGEKFVDLLIEIGIPKEIIFFSSRYHTGVEIGYDFHKEIKEHLRTCEIVVFLLTKNFYTSPACLNEMGAAWVLDKNIYPILLGDLEHSDMKGFIDSHYIAFKPKEGEEYKLSSKLNPYITTRNTQKPLQDICADFISEAKKISEYSNQYIDLSYPTMSDLEEMIVKKKFTDGEILVLEYFRQNQNNLLIDSSSSSFCKYIEEYREIEYTIAIRLLKEDGYIYDEESRDNSYCIKMEYFRQLMSLGTVPAAYIESVKSKYKRATSTVAETVSLNSNIVDKYILSENTRELEILLIAYAYDKMVNSFGDRWMASGTIASIEEWERNNNIDMKLSRNYSTALNLLINREVLEVASCTSYGNPREYKFRADFWRSLSTINKQSLKVMEDAKASNYHMDALDDPLPF